MNTLAQRAIRSTMFAVLLAVLSVGLARAQDVAPLPVSETTRSSPAADGEAFLAENKAKDGVVTLPSGVQYKVLKAGTGKTATMDDSVICHFRGSHIDGSEFTSSYVRKKPATVALKRVIKGWAEALQLMPVGSKWQLFIPAHLAYGERGVRGRVPPHATVIFDVELLAIADSQAQTAKPSPLRSIQVAFKLDNRLTQGLYMGERWVSPPTYNHAGTATSVTVDARATGVDTRGAGKAIAATWVSADPERVTVTPAQGNVVAITVHGAGESSVKVMAGGRTRELTIKARHVSGVLQVEITQAQPATE